jgi:peptide/nickel transport system permease protein
VTVTSARALISKRATRTAVRALVTLARSVAIFVPVFFVATFVTFALRALTGLSPARMQLGEDATPQAIHQIEAHWGLDRSFAAQYWSWLDGVLHGQLGTSWATGASVTTLIADGFAISLSVATLALVIGIVFGFGFGTLAALRPTTWIDRTITGVMTVFSVMPALVVGIVLVELFAVGLGWLPSGGYVPISSGAGLWLSHIILPALALSFDTVSDVRNGAGPGLAVLGLKFPALIGGSVITEYIFGLQGFGRFATASAQTGDVPSVQGVLVVSIVLVVVFNLIVNVFLARVTPASMRGV